MTIKLNGAALKEARKARGMTTDALLVALTNAGISVSTHTLRAWERSGYTPASIRLLGALSHLLDVDLSVLVTVDE